MSQGLPELASDQRRGQCIGNQRYSFRDIKYNRCPGLSFFIKGLWQTPSSLQAKKTSKAKWHLSWNYSVTCSTECLSHIIFLLTRMTLRRICKRQPSPLQFCPHFQIAGCGNLTHLNCVTAVRKLPLYFTLCNTDFCIDS